MAKHNKLGKEGELIAFMFLQKENFYILKTNWRYQKAEVDIIAQKDGFLVFVAVEVKPEAVRDSGNQKKLLIKRKLISIKMLPKGIWDNTHLK